MASRFYYTFDMAGLPAENNTDHPWSAGPAMGQGRSLVTAKDDRYASMTPITYRLFQGGPFNLQFGVWYSPRLAAQQLSGTVSGMVHITADAGMTVRPDMRIALVSSTGTLRAWLYTGATGTSNPDDQAPPGVVTLPPTPVQEGDRLRIDLGVIGTSGIGGLISMDLTAQSGIDLEVYGLEWAQGHALTVDPAHPRLLLVGEGTTVLTEDPAHPRLYSIGT